MANQYSESEIKRQLSGRQARDARGRFLSLKPEQRLSAVRASRAMPTASGAEPPPIGMAEAAGQTQPSPLMVSAAALLREAKNLSIDAQFAESQEAKQIYAKIQVIRKLAERSADSAAVTAKIDEVIKPVEEQLRKKASFGEFVRERIQEFRKTLPERLLSKIPVVGGLLGGFMRQRREAQEQMSEYERNILRRGTGGIGIGGFGGTRGGMDALGERERQFETRQAAGFPTKTIESIYKEVVAIRKSVDKIARVSGNGGARGILDSLKNRLFGRRSRIGRLFRRGRLATRRMMRGLRRGGGRLFGRVSRAARAVGGGVTRAARAVGGGVAKAAGAVGRTAASVASTGSSWFGNLMGGAKNLAGSAWEGAKNLGGRAIEGAKNLGGKALESIKSLSPGKQISKIVSGSARGIAKVVMNAPVLGAIIAAIMQGAEIKAIKDDPTLSADEKKEKIGVGVMKLLGAAGGAALGTWLGGAGGAALGSVVPVLGTAAGGWIGSLVGALGGEWVGKTLMGALGESLGGREIYDLVASIPGLGSMIAVDEVKPTETAGAEGQLPEGTAGSMSMPTEVTGTITAPATPNTTVGKMANQYAAEQDALQDATASAVSGPASNPTVNTANVRSSVTNNINNFNDDLRIRNNEPTLKTMQAASHVF